jgi:hypothetical protein
MGWLAALNAPEKASVRASLQKRICRASGPVGFNNGRALFEANRNGTPTEDYEETEHAIPTGHHPKKENR